MLKNTFCHGPGIGPKTEQWIWNQEILGRDGFKAPYPPDLSRRQTDDLIKHLPEL